MALIETARKLAELEQAEDACKAYGLLLEQGGEPEERLEAASYLFDHHKDHRVSYTAFVKLYQEGYFQEELFSLLREAFYEPNLRQLRRRYKRNCALLSGYRFFFRHEFPEFEDLPLCFFPFDDNSGYLPFDRETERFGDYVQITEPVIRHYFFKDLEKPILARDIYSQYELEYLNDNVRKSEWVAKENHIYLHYSSFQTFCAWLQVLDLTQLLKEKKFVFLIEDELEQYPIDFKARFGIDYSKYPVQRVSTHEIHRLIWHTQLSTHNGGDFFNEIFDSHPNLIFVSSIMFDNVEQTVRAIQDGLKQCHSLREAQERLENWKDPGVLSDLYYSRQRTDKDVFAALFMEVSDSAKQLDPGQRIAPAVFFQPHFPNINYQIHLDREGRAVLDSKDLADLYKAKLFQSFKYIKTFTPIRRITTSYAASVKFMYKSHLDQQREEPDAERKVVVPDAVTQRVLNRSFMRNPDQRLYKDSVIVRFEDGKLNPKATFTRLAAFLDLPYTESMTYCSDGGVRDNYTEGNVIGFDPATVYRTYDEYANENERKYLEFFMRDAYAFYGYDFQYYDGTPVDMETVKQWVSGFDTINHLMLDSHHDFFLSSKLSGAGNVGDVGDAGDDLKDEIVRQLENNLIERSDRMRLKTANALLNGLFFINFDGQPLRMTPLLEPDPALLEQPLYH